MLNIVERERVVRLHIEHLPEGVYLATSEDVQGLIAQGRTVAEVVEIARDVARKLIEAQSDLSLPAVAESFDYPLVVGG
jgi:predicted RNase H-like HicB family nuclease